MSTPINTSRLRLWQLISPALPVGAYSYSEGLEYLVETAVISNQESLAHWLTNELSYGAIRLEAAILWRAYHCWDQGNLAQLISWNQWLSAARETAELRQQSWQMGQSLLKLLGELAPELKHLNSLPELKPCNYAIAFAVGAAQWQILPEQTLMGYLQSWVSNLIGAGVKLIPLGQTAGQQILFDLTAIIEQMSQEIPKSEDDLLGCWSWGLGLASMNHETQYTRLFRS